MSSKSKRGFASMDPERQREIASKGGHAAQEFQVVKNFHVVAQALMEMRAEDFGGPPGFRAADAAGLGRVILHTAAATIGHVQVMRLPAGVPEQHKRPGHENLDVVRVRADGNCGFHFVRFQL